MKDMGTPANGFCKPRIGSEEDTRIIPITIREAVAKYGDEWRLMMTGTTFIRMEHMERETHDTWDALYMREMERGERPRVRVWDIHDDC